MSLDRLLIPPGAGPFPTAAQHNGVLAHLLAQRLLGVIPTGGGSQPFLHPWQVTVDRLGVRAGATLPPETWRVEVAAGCVRDQLATIPYRRTGDPRGWSLPAGYVAPVPGAPDYDADYLERDPLDDPDDPPFLVARELLDFRQISDDLRPTIEAGAFCGAADWDKELWRSHVILSAVPTKGATLFPGAARAPLLKRFRLYIAPEKPDANYGAKDGGAVEIATLYLLRDPATPSASELIPRQQEWWPLWIAIVQPTSTVDPTLGQGVQDAVDNILADSISVLFWTV